MKAIASLLLALSTLPALAGYKVVAYYYGEGADAHGYTVDHIPAGQLTHLNYAFAVIKDGVAVWGDKGLDQATRTRLAGLRKLKQAHRGLRTILSVGGWGGSKYFSDVAFTPEARRRFADSLVAMMREQGFDGIDIDWEFPVEGGDAGNVTRPEDKQDYTLLLAQLRTTLDQAGRKARRHFLLTSATNPGERWLRNTEMDKAIRYLDWVNLMTYDFNGPWNAYSGHVAPLAADPANTRPDAGPKLNVAGAVALYRAAGVPAAKIVLGLPFYGYTWTGCAPADDGQYQDCKGKGSADGSLDYATLAASYVDRNGYVRHWNAAAKAPYLFKPENGEFISYEDPQSIGLKLDLVKAQGLGGAMFWEISNDKDGVLLDAVAHGLSR